MTLFRRLTLAWQYAKDIPSYNDKADAVGFWTPVDAEAYTNFMESPSGQKLRLMQRNFMVQRAVSAVHAETNSKYQCGKAAGTTATFRWLDSHLTSPSSANDEIDGSEPGVPDSFADIAP